MPSKKSPSRCPLVALEAEIRADAALADEVRDRLVWDARKVREETPRASILVRELQAAAMRVVWGLQAGGHDLLTRCRALGELVRALRALGLLRMGGGSGSLILPRGRHGHGRTPPLSPAARPADDEEVVDGQAGDVPDGEVHDHEPEGETDDSAA